MPKLLEKRPQPPDLQDILEDLTNSEPDDVVFNFFTASARSSEVQGAAHVTDTTLSNKHAEDSSWEPAETETETKKNQELSEAENCYQKVTKLIECYKYLKNSQTSLAENCNELEVMGQKVQEQISQLKVRLSRS